MPTGSMRTSDWSRCDAIVASSAPIQPPNEAPTVEPELVEQIEIVEREVRDVLDPRGVRRAAVTGMAREVHGEALRETLLERQPASRAAGAVEEEQRGARAGGQEMDRGPADRELAALDRHQPMKSPPFGDSHCPVKNEPSSDARNSAVAATSRGSPERPRGVRARAAARISGDIGWVMGVSM